MKVVQPFGRGGSKSGLRLHLCDINADMTDAWLDSFFGVEAVEILQGDLLEAGADAVVAPDNSFGDMSGGLDKHIDDYYHGAAQEAITARIQSELLGELPVGMAIVVPMQNMRLPFVVAAPTLRVPEDAAHKLNAYLAMRASLVAVHQHNQQSEAPIRTLAVSGLCTGVGRMPCAVAARQMRTAYDAVVGEEWKKVLHPVMAPYAFRRKGIDAG